MKELFGNLKGGRIYAAASRPGVDKTLFCLTFATFVANKGSEVLYLSDSLTEEEFDSYLEKMPLVTPNVVFKRAFHLHRQKLETLLDEGSYDYLVLDPFDIYAYDIDMGDLKEIAVEKGMDIILTKNVLRLPLDGSRKHHTLSDIKFLDKKVGAKFMSYTDIILFLDQDPETSQLKARVAKNLFGRIGYTIPL